MNNENKRQGGAHALNMNFHLPLPFYSVTTERCVIVLMGVCTSLL